MARSASLGCVLVSLGLSFGCQTAETSESLGSSALSLEVPACTASATGAGVHSGNLVVNAATDPQTLAGIWCVTGHLDIDNVGWVDAAPLAQLQAVVGRLGITNSVNMTSLNGLQALQRVGALYLTNDAKLETLDVLAGLTNVGTLGLNQLPRLRNLHGLEQITKAGAVTIGSNALLGSLEGLRIRETSGIFAVTNNPALTSLAGAETLSRVGLDLWLISNGALVDLAPLSGVTYVGRTIRVSQHARLQSLAGLSGITRPGPFSGNLQVFGNPLLDQCQVQALSVQTGLPCGSCGSNLACSGAAPECSARACVSGACGVVVTPGVACGTEGLCAADGSCQPTRVTISVPGLGARTFVDVHSDGVWDNAYPGIDVYAYNVGWLNQRSRQRVAIEWALSAIPAGATVEHANLHLDPIRVKWGSGFNVEFRGYAGDGVLGPDDIDAGGDVLASLPVSGTTSQQDIELDVTALVSSVWQAGAQTLGLNLRTSSEAERQRTVDDKLVCVSFGEGTAVFTEPRLDVTYRLPTP